MRKVTKNAITAFNNFEAGNFGNTKVVISLTGATAELYLHGNLIARNYGLIEITNAGWKTNTTKERLNALPGVSIQQKAGVWHLNGKEWNGKWATIDIKNNSWVYTQS